MGDHDHGSAFLGQALHNLQYLTDQLRVQSRGGFVKQHDFRFHGQGAGNGCALLLATGHLGRIVVLALVDTHLVQVGFGALDGFFLGNLEHVNRRFNNVFKHGHVGPEIEALEHHGKFCPDQFNLFVIRRDTFALTVGCEPYWVAVHDNVAGGGCFQQVDATQEGTLAGTGAADQGNHIAFAGLQ